MAQRAKFTNDVIYAGLRSTHERIPGT